jgi:hypothetical protein
MTICPVGAELYMRTDGRTDMTKLIVAFRNFANESKNQDSLIIYRYCKDNHLSLRVQTQCRGPPSLLLRGYWGFFPRRKVSEVSSKLLTT